MRSKILRQHLRKFIICFSPKMRLLSLRTFLLLKSPSKLTPQLGRRDSIIIDILTSDLIFLLLAFGGLYSVPIIM